MICLCPIEVDPSLSHVGCQDADLLQPIVYSPAIIFTQKVTTSSVLVVRLLLPPRLPLLLRVLLFVFAVYYLFLLFIPFVAFVTFVAFVAFWNAASVGNLYGMQRTAPRRARARPARRRRL